MSKVTIQGVQLNNVYGNQVFIPYSVGMLGAYVQMNETINKKVDFKPFLYRRDKLSTLVNAVDKVNILAVSCYVWNWELSTALAKEVKKKDPDCTIIFGGPHVPDMINEEFFKEYPFIDFTCHGEGELVFSEFLEKYINGDDLTNIQSITYHNRSTGMIYNNLKRPRIMNLDEIPSPYLSGIFDELLSSGKNMSWVATWETNRGCPYKCTFCDWGSLTAQKIAKLDLNRLFAEVDYFSDKNIDLIFGADANFGILERDLEIAEKLVDNKKKYNYPNNFRVCFAKNSHEKIFKIAKTLYDGGMNKGVSLSMQSMDNVTLENIKRSNIKLESFKKLQSLYVENSMATYSEMILAMPGETYQSFVNGLDKLIENGQHTGINIYNCSIMPNAEMGDYEYQKKYGMKIVRIPIFQAHSSRKSKSDNVIEYESIVVATDSMPVEDWRKTYKFSWAIQCFHSLGLLQAISIILRNIYGIKYVKFYESIVEYYQEYLDKIIGQEIIIMDNILDNILAGIGSDQYLPNFLDITWPPEEATFLRVSEKLNQFYEELTPFLKNLLSKTGIEINDELIQDIIKYQKAIMVKYDCDDNIDLKLKYNINELFKMARSGQIVDLKNGIYNHMIVCDKKYSKDKNKFAKEVIWFGRKGGKFFYPVKNYQIHNQQVYSVDPN